MMRKKVLTLAVFVGAMLLLTATGVLAASPAASNPHPILQEPTAPPAITATTGITNPVATLLAAYFDRTVEDILAWHDEGLGYGEIAIAFFLSQSSDEEVEEIIRLRQEEGLGWGEIAKELGLATGNRGRNLGVIMSGRAITVTQTMTGTVGTRARGPKETPPGWDLGNGSGLGRGHGRGHNK